jgi:tetratricopeptide (TPR) repeat protein
VKAAGYTTRDLAKLVEVSEARVRAFVADGFLHPRRGPRGELRFTFPDVVLLRAAQGLREAGVSPHRVRQALRRLHDALPAGRPLASVRIAAVGSEIVVQDAAGKWEPVSGQSLIDFEVRELAENAAPMARRAAERAREQAAEFSAADWFELGLDLEATAAHEARDAYRRALELDPAHADAHVNLGRLLHEEGQIGAAAEHYRRAAALDPADAIAHYNLGVALEDQGALTAAIRAYLDAVAADAAFADAHFNLAGVYEKQGKQALALRTLKVYRKLVRGDRR